ncbi:hypothetical protein L1987_59894 [Smallanthus sonchifolius]|uniref:Uncharacterized protein n=1 Tax=Smallanthus sonchifolius TaxID=185202 RepID=A0ACB9D6K6_9ASTR|nr:hypothetical protein L1987_59894 [Smallanthus sonchifolius]
MSLQAIDTSQLTDPRYSHAVDAHCSHYVNFVLTTGVSQARLQAYYGSGAAPILFATNITSSSRHPYIWGGQHLMMPPYGTPVPYPYVYPPTGVYGHPSMPMIPDTMQPNTEEF